MEFNRGRRYHEKLRVLTALSAYVLNLPSIGECVLDHQGLIVCNIGGASSSGDDSGSGSGSNVGDSY